MSDIGSSGLVWSITNAMVNYISYNYMFLASYFIQKKTKINSATHIPLANTKTPKKTLK